MSKLSYLKGVYHIIKDNDIRYFFNLIWVNTYNMFVNKGLGIMVLTTRETLKKFKNSRKSMIRWGDADTRLALRGNIYYQDSSTELKNHLIKILKEYNDDSPYLLCTRFTINMDSRELRRLNKLQFWGSSKYFFRNKMNKNAQYGEATLFYDPKIPQKEIFSIWEDASNIILIHFNKKNYHELKRHYPKKKIFFVQPPQNNAFEVREKLLAEILAHVEKNKLSKENTKMLLSAGPGARVLVYELSKMGFVAYDIGTYFGTTTYEEGQGFFRSVFDKDKSKHFKLDL